MPERFVYHKRQPQTNIPFPVIPEALISRYGEGIEYPPKLSNGRQWLTASGMSKITQSMYIILLTPLGSRFNEPEFGSLLPLLPMSAVNPDFTEEVRQNVIEAIQRWEPRVTLRNVRIDLEHINSNVVQIIIEYTVKGLGTQGIFSLPFDTETRRATATPIEQFVG